MTRSAHTPALLLAAAAIAAALTAATRPAARPARNAPASRPASAPKAEPARLAAECDAAAKRMLARLDRSFHAVVRPPFVVIGNLPPARLRQIAEGSVVAPARAMWSSYFDARPTRPIVALLFDDAGSYRRWAKELFGDTDLPHFGYCRTADRTLVMNIATGTGTLVHELTHALIVPDFPDVPTWFNEGLASLHEQCSVHTDRIVGRVNWRLPALQDAIRTKKLRPLRELLTADDFRTNQVGLNYAQARYFVMYMQQRGVLRRFYKTFRRRRAEPDAAVTCVEEVFGEKLQAVEQKFLAWVQTLRWP